MPKLSTHQVEPFLAEAVTRKRRAEGTKKEDEYISFKVSPSVKLLFRLEILLARPSWNLEASQEDRLLPPHGHRLHGTPLLTWVIDGGG